MEVYVAAHPGEIESVSIPVFSRIMRDFISSASTFSNISFKTPIIGQIGDHLNFPIPRSSLGFNSFFFKKKG